MRLTVKVLKDLAKAGHCVVLITHDMDLISAAADGVLYIVNGEVRYHRNTLRDKVNKTYYQCIANNVCNTSNRNKD